MKINWGWGPKTDGAPRSAVTVEDGEPAAGAGREQAPAQSAWTGGSALASKVATGVLWTALAAGPIALLVGPAFGSAPAPVRAAAPVVDRAGEQAAAGEFAGRLVRMWLSGVRGQEEQLAPLVRGGAQVVLPAVGWQVGPATTADVRRQPDGTYLVVTAVPVAASRAGAGAGAAADAGTTSAGTAAGGPVRFFAVPVHVGPSGLVALALPAPVAGPSVAPDGPQLAYRYSALASDPLGVSVQQFLDALLTGGGDVTRLTSPGTVINPVEPPLYSSVQVQDIATDRQLAAHAAVPADGTRLRAFVTATVTGAPQQQSAVQYPLTLTVRGGRWEITAIDPAPALQPTERAVRTPGPTASGAAGTSSSTPAPSGSTTPSS